MRNEKRVKWGVIGTAQIANVAFAPAIARSETSILYAIASRSQERAAEFARCFQVEKVCSSYDAVLADSRVDVVYIPLPNSLHYEWIMKSLEAEKHVLCEKPLVLSVGQVDEIAKKSASKNLLVMEAFMYRFHPRIARVHDLLKSGAIGEVRAVKANYCFKLQTAADVLSGGYTDNIRLSANLGGGALLDVGCYCIDAIHSFMRAQPLSVMAWSYRPEKDGVDLRSGGLIEFANGGIGEFFCAIDTFGGGHVEIWGSDGKITVPTAFRLRPAQTEVPLVVETASGATSEMFSYSDQYLAEIDTFARSITGNRQDLTPLSDTRANVSILQAARASWTEGVRVQMQ